MLGGEMKAVRGKCVMSSHPHPSTHSIRRAAPLQSLRGGGEGGVGPPATDIRDPRLLDGKPKPQMKESLTLWQARVGWRASPCRIHDSRPVCCSVVISDCRGAHPLSPNNRNSEPKQ